MPIGIGSNITSLKAQRRLSEGTSELSKTYTRLSSGQRINKASDDAAGLAISTALNSRAQVYGQAVRNANDGISLYSIADATVGSLTDINIRLQELAEQSANGVYSATQRKAIDAEAQALAKEYFRISRSAQFNGQRLFDGSMGSGLTLQLGYGTSGTITAAVGGKLGDGTVAIASTFTADNLLTYRAALGDLNGDSILDMVTIGTNALQPTISIRIGDGRGGFSTTAVYTDSGYAWNGLALGDLNGDGAQDIVVAGASGGAGRAMVLLNSGAGSFTRAGTYATETTRSTSVSLADLNNDGILDLATAGQGGAQGSATVRLGTGGGAFGSVTAQFKTENSYSNGIVIGDIDNDGKLDIVTAGVSGASGVFTVATGNGDGTFVGRATLYTADTTSSNTLAIGDLNGDGRLDVVTAGLSGVNGTTTVRLGTGGTSFSAAVSYSTLMISVNDVRLSDLNGDGNLDIIAAGTNVGSGVSIRLGNASGSFGARTYMDIGSGMGTGGGLAIGDVDGDGVTDAIHVVGYYSYATYTSSGQATVLFGNTRDGISPLQPFSLASKGEALQALGLFSRTSKNLSDIRATLGATQSRINTAVSGLVTTRENFIAAGARIRDADIGQETARLVSTQIRQQAAAAVLAQANLAPQLALRLLS